MARPGGIVLDIGPEPHDEIVDGARVGVLVQAPHFLQHRLPRDRTALVPDEMPQEIRFHQGEREDLSAHSQLELVEVHRLFAKREGVAERARSGVERSAEPLAAAHETLYAGDQDGELEGFGQVIVNTGGETAQDVLGASARRQHQRGHELPGLAELGDHGEAVLTRQHYVEDDNVERLRAAEEHLESRLTVAHHFDGISFSLEVEPQPFGEVLLVFHHQYSRHLAIGNSTTNVLPFPGPSLSAHALPPWRLATERTMYNPSPVPFTADANCPGTR